MAREFGLLARSGEVRYAPSSSGSDATAVTLDDPEGVSVGGNGSVFIADTSHGQIEQLKIAPSPPALTSASATTNSVSVEWSSSSQDGGLSLSGYQVVVSESSTRLATVDVSPDMNATTISDLASGTTYSIEVEASNAIGISSPSDPITFTTESIPAPPGTNPPPQPSPAPNSNLSPTKGNTRPHVVVKVTKAQALSSAGFVSFLARCSDQSCAGTVILRGIVRIEDVADGTTHAIEQTFVAGSSHFAIRGKRFARVLIPLTQYARRVVESGRALDIRGVVSLDTGRKSFFSVLVAKSRTTSGAADVQRRAAQAIHPLVGGTR